jgi:hypothetical protein
VLATDTAKSLAGLASPLPTLRLTTISLIMTAFPGLRFGVLPPIS